MPIRRVSNQTFQFRQAVRRAQNMQGLGIIRRSDRVNTNRQILRKLQERENRQIATLNAQRIVSAYNPEQLTAYERLISGTGTFSDFRQTDEFKQIIKEYGDDRGKYLAEITYYDIIMANNKFLSSADFDKLQRAKNAAASSFYKRTKIFERSRLSKSERLTRDIASRERREQILALNRAGFTTEGGFTKPVQETFKRPAGFSSLFGYPNTPIFSSKLYQGVTGVSTNSGYRPILEPFFSSMSKKKGK